MLVLCVLNICLPEGRYHEYENLVYRLQSYMLVSAALHSVTECVMISWLPLTFYGLCSYFQPNWLSLNCCSEIYRILTFSACSVVTNTEWSIVLNKTNPLNSSGSVFTAYFNMHAKTVHYAHKEQRLYLIEKKFSLEQASRTRIFI
jgi:hypothetical protein